MSLTALYYATSKQFNELVLMLLKKGAEVSLSGLVSGTVFAPATSHTGEMQNLNLKMMIPYFNDVIKDKVETPYLAETVEDFFLKLQSDSNENLRNQFPEYFKNETALMISVLCGGKTEVQKILQQVVLENSEEKSWVVKALLLAFKHNNTDALKAFEINDDLKSMCRNFYLTNEGQNAIKLTLTSCLHNNYPDMIDNLINCFTTSIFKLIEKSQPVS